MLCTVPGTQGQPSKGPAVRQMRSPRLGLCPRPSPETRESWTHSPSAWAFTGSWNTNQALDLAPSQPSIWVVTGVRSLQRKATSRVNLRETAQLKPLSVEPWSSLGPSLMAVAPAIPETMLNEPCGSCLPRLSLLLRRILAQPPAPQPLSPILSTSCPVLHCVSGKKHRAPYKQQHKFQEQVRFAEHLFQLQGLSYKLSMLCCA